MKTTYCGAVVPPIEVCASGAESVRCRVPERRVRRYLRPPCTVVDSGCWCCDGGYVTFWSCVAYASRVGTWNTRGGPSYFLLPLRVPPAQVCPHSHTMSV